MIVTIILSLSVLFELKPKVDTMFDNSLDVFVSTIENISDIDLASFSLSSVVATPKPPYIYTN